MTSQDTRSSSPARAAVARRLLQNAELYGFLEQRDRRYRLTEAGKTAPATQQVFVPEHGTWTVRASDDPLLAAPILRVEPWMEPIAYHEVRGKGRDDARKRPFDKLPGWVRDVVGVVATPLVGGAPLRVDELDVSGRWRPLRRPSARRWMSRVAACSSTAHWATVL